MTENHDKMVDGASSVHYPRVRSASIGFRQFPCVFAHIFRVSIPLPLFFRQFSPFPDFPIMYRALSFNLDYAELLNHMLASSAKVLNALDKRQIVQESQVLSVQNTERVQMGNHRINPSERQYGHSVPPRAIRTETSRHLSLQLLVHERHLAPTSPAEHRKL
jgi:hypothetical protein